MGVIYVCPRCGHEERTEIYVWEEIKRPCKSHDECIAHLRDRLRTVEDTLERHNF